MTDKELGEVIEPVYDYEDPGPITDEELLLCAEARALEYDQEEAASDKTVHPAFQEALDFLTSRPTPEQIITFKASPLAQQRLEELLDKNGEEGLTDEEEAELDVYEQLHNLMILLKTHARTVQPQRN